MSESRPFVAGVDSSTQSCKVVICDPVTGRIVREGRAPHPEGSEVAPQAWWDAFLEAVHTAGGLDDVRALSVGGQQHGMVCLDSQGEVIRPALLWNDTRSAEAARELVLERGDGDREAGARWWAQATGLVPVASFTVTKLRWLADNEPENARKIAAICLPHDWLSWKIRGGFGAVGLEGLCTDRSDASGTGYMDRERSSYRREILAQALRISVEEAEGIILPKICDPVEAMGFGDPTQGWGEIAIGPGCGDNAGAALGVGLGVGQALLSLGTSGVVSVVSEIPIEDPSGQVAGFADASGHWLPLACTLNASRILDAVGAMSGLGYEELDDAALSVPDAGGLRLVPYFEGERTPNLPDATARLEGMTLKNSTRAHLARAGVEGLLAHMRFALECVRELGVPIEKVLVVGGGARSRAVQSLAPEFLGVPVEFPAVAEYVALGAARQAGALNLADLGTCGQIRHYANRAGGLDV